MPKNRVEKSPLRDREVRPLDIGQMIDPLILLGAELDNQYRAKKLSLTPKTPLELLDFLIGNANVGGLSPDWIEQARREATTYLKEHNIDNIYRELRRLDFFFIVGN